MSKLLQLMNYFLIKVSLNYMHFALSNIGLLYECNMHMDASNTKYVGTMYFNGSNIKSL